MNSWKKNILWECGNHGEENVEINGNGWVRFGGHVMYFKKDWILGFAFALSNPLYKWVLGFFLFGLSMSGVDTLRAMNKKKKNVSFSSSECSFWFWVHNPTQLLLNVLVWFALFYYKYLSFICFKVLLYKWLNLSLCISLKFWNK
jgi:hypothetical protein